MGRGCISTLEILISRTREWACCCPTADAYISIHPSPHPIPAQPAHAPTPLSDGRTLLSSPLPPPTHRHQPTATTNLPPNLPPIHPPIHPPLHLTSSPSPPCTSLPPSPPPPLPPTQYVPTSQRTPQPLLVPSTASFPPVSAAICAARSLSLTTRGGQGPSADGRSGRGSPTCGREAGWYGGRSAAGGGGGSEAMDEIGRHKLGVEEGSWFAGWLLLNGLLAGLPARWLAGWLDLCHPLTSLPSSPLHTTMPR